MDERMLRLALMEANLERFREVLEGTDRDWNWSPRYLRSRTRVATVDSFSPSRRAISRLLSSSTHFSSSTRRYPSGRARIRSTR